MVKAWEKDTQTYQLGVAFLHDMSTYVVFEQPSDFNQTTVLL